MTPDKDKALCEKYPKIFRDRNASPQETCMCWGLDVGDGWFDLIDTLCGSIQHHVDWKFKGQEYKVKSGQLSSEDVKTEDELQVIAVQVKEKFGGLRFYVGAADEEVNGMIRMAESMSYKICEECGCPGRPSKEGWIRTLCPPCRESYDKKRAERWKKEDSK